jgi:hypothetical protein
MTTLSGRTLDSSFGELLKIDSVGMTTSLQSVEDGNGVASPLMLSTTAISLNGLQWPTSGGTNGAFLQLGSNNMLNWTTINLNPVIPAASATTVGGIRLSDEFSIDSQGILTISPDYAAYTLPVASATTLGGVMVGTNLAVNDGVLSAFGYTLPTASATQMGGVIIGENINVSSTGVISCASYSLPIATVSSVGGVIVGENLTVDTSGVISATAYTLPAATATTMGGVIIGEGLEVDSTGTISVPLQNPTPLSSGNVMYSAVNPGSGYLQIATPQLCSLTDSTYANIVALFPNTEWTTVSTNTQNAVTALLKFSISERIFVVAGTQIATSTDGMTWNSQTLVEQITCISGVTTGSSVTYIAGCISGNFGRSVDGINWTFTSPSVQEQVNAISPVGYIASTFGANKAMTSTDGINWAPLPVAFTVDRFVQRSNNTVIGTAAYSNQCYTITSSGYTPLGSPAPVALDNLTQYNDLTYFSSGLSTSAITIYSTPDFVNYTPIVISITSSTAVGVTDMWWTANDNLIVTTNTSIILVSTDGVNFQLVDTGVPATMSSVVDLNNVTYLMSTSANAIYAYTPADYDTTQYFQVPAMPAYFPSYMPYLKL